MQWHTSERVVVVYRQERGRKVTFPATLFLKHVTFCPSSLKEQPTDMWLRLDTLS
jgi:hypothetical protein